MPDTLLDAGYLNVIVLGNERIGCVCVSQRRGQSIQIIDANQLVSTTQMHRVHFQEVFNYEFVHTFACISSPSILKSGDRIV